MCRSSRVIIFRFISKTPWQMFLLLYSRHECAPPNCTNMASAQIHTHIHFISTRIIRVAVLSQYQSIQSAIHLGNTLLRVTCEWKTAKTWFLARLPITQSSIVSQILDFIYWMVTTFSFDHDWRKPTISRSVKMLNNTKSNLCCWTIFWTLMILLLEISTQSFKR